MEEDNPNLGIEKAGSSRAQKVVAAGGFWVADGTSGKGGLGLMMLWVGSSFTLRVSLLYCWTFWDVFVLKIWPLFNCVLALGFEIFAPRASVIRARKHHVDRICFISSICFLFYHSLRGSWIIMLTLSVCLWLPSIIYREKAVGRWHLEVFRARRGAEDVKGAMYPMCGLRLKLPC